MSESSGPKKAAAAHGPVSGPEIEQQIKRELEQHPLLFLILAGLGLVAFLWWRGHISTRLAAWLSQVWVVGVVVAGVLLLGVLAFLAVRHRERLRGLFTAVRRPLEGAEHREVERLRREWDTLMEAAKMTGTKLVHWHHHGGVTTLDMRLAPGLTHEYAERQRRALEQVLGGNRDALGLEPHPSERADHIRVHLVRQNRLHSPRGWSGPASDTIGDPLRLGRYQRGGDVELRLGDHHMFISGITGSGKSRFVNLLLAEVLSRVDALVWGIDGKDGLELAPWERLLDRFVDTDLKARRLLEAAMRIHKTRAAILRQRGEQEWTPTRANPLIVIVIDEVTEIGLEAAVLLNRLSRVCRATGIRLVMCTQYPSKEELGKIATAKRQAVIRVSFTVDDAVASAVVFGAGSVRQGWKAHELPMQGWMLVKDPEHQVPQVSRADLIDKPGVLDAVRGLAGHQPRLDAASERAGFHETWVPNGDEDDPGAPRAVDEDDGLESDVEQQEMPIDDQRLDPEEVLLEQLASHGESGVRAERLVGSVPRSRAWVFQTLKTMQARGQVAPAGRGRWRRV